MDPIRARAGFRLAPSPRPRPSDLEGGHGSPPRSAAESGWFRFVKYEDSPKVMITSGNQMELYIYIYIILY